MIGKGCVHVYTGPGKGKTTAALGLAIRACGAGMKVFFGQFLKNGDTSEMTALERFADLVTARQYGSGRFVRGAPSDEDRELGAKGLADAKEAMLSGDYQMVFMDEANVAANYGIIAVEDLLEMIRTRPDGVELIITGRNADQRIIEAADLATEMREIKHYYKAGVAARRGVEK